MDEAVSVLVDHGYLRQETAGGKGRGVKGATFTANPKALRQCQTEAQACRHQRRIQHQRQCACAQIKQEFVRGSIHEAEEAAFNWAQE